MPNWCENRLTIGGPAADVDALIARVVVPNPNRHPEYGGAERAVDYAALAPLPERFTARGEDRGLEHDEYAWRVAHWSCKWNQPELIRDDRKDFPKSGTARLVYDFAGSWGPPLPFVQALAGAFPRLRLVLRYREDGQQIRGAWDSRVGGDDTPPAEIERQLLDMFRPTALVAKGPTPATRPRRR